MRTLLTARPTTSFIITAGIALAFFAALTGCAKRETQVVAGNRTQTLHIGNLSEPKDLDPHVAESNQTSQINRALFEGLAMYDPATCAPVPGVAERWESSDDAKRWTFHLRKNARWSNGDPVTAHDFVFSFRRILSPGLGAEYAPMLYVLKNGEAFNRGTLKDASQIGAIAADDHTLVLELDAAVGYLPKMVCHSAWFPVHRATIEKHGRFDERGTAWTRPGNLVGNGYFVLDEWKPNQIIRCSKSPTYWDRDAVKLNGVCFYPIESQDSEERAFRSGQLHVTADIPLSKIAVYKNEHPELLQSHIVLATYLYRFNVTQPPLNDVRVRRALALSIDRASITKEVTRGGQIPASHFTPPDTDGFTARIELPYDVTEARRLLAEAGFPDGKNFPRLSLLYNTHDGHKAIAEAVQQMWRRALGIDISLVNQEGKVWHDSMVRLDYQIARFAWVGDYVDPSTFLDIMTTGNGNNNTGWSNAEYDRLILAAKNTTDQKQRYAMFQRCEEILSAEMPMAPVYFYVRNRLTAPSVKNFPVNLLDAYNLKGVYLQP